MSQTAFSFLRELQDYHEEHVQRCRAMGWLRSLFHVRVSVNITTDLAEAQQKNSRWAHSAEVEDLEAAELLERALQGGLDNSDRPMVLKAIRHLKRSANLDRDICHDLST